MLIQLCDVTRTNIRYKRLLGIDVRIWRGIVVEVAAEHFACRVTNRKGDHNSPLTKVFVHELLRVMLGVSSGIGSVMLVSLRNIRMRNSYEKFKCYCRVVQCRMCGCVLQVCLGTFVGYGCGASEVLFIE